MRGSSAHQYRIIGVTLGAARVESRQVRRIERGAAAEPVAAALKTAVRDTFGLTPEVVVLASGTLAKEFEASVKTPRFADRRQ